MHIATIAAIVAAVPPATAALALLLAAPAVEWRWRAPAGCPDEATTRRELDAATPAACALAADAAVRRTPDGWHLDLRLERQGRVSERPLDAGTCRALADAAVVIVTVACSEDPEAAPGPLVPEPAPPLDPPLAPPDAPPPTPSEPPLAPTPPAEPSPGLAPRAPPPAARARARPIGELGLHGGVAWAPTLAPAAHLGPVFRLRWRRVDLVLSAGYTGARIHRYPQAPALGVAQRLAHAGLAACPALDWGRGRARGRGGLCLGAELGAVIGTGLGTPEDRTRARPWAALGLAPVLGWLPHPRLALALQLDLLASLSRPAFRLEDLEPIARVAPFGVRLRTMLLVRLF